MCGGRKWGLPCPHINGVSFENVNEFLKRKTSARDRLRGVFCITCGHICLRHTGCDQHLKGFLIRHRMSHTSQRPQSIPRIVTKRATPLPSLFSSHFSIYGSHFLIHVKCVRQAVLIAADPLCYKETFHCLSVPILNHTATYSSSHLANICN